MLMDANGIEGGRRLDADVCVVGAGPAGLTVARELQTSGLSVILVESGELKPHRELKSLNDGETEGDPYLNPRWGRHRQVGGTANRWLVDIGNGDHGARYAPLEPVDFEARPAIPHSGWPISREDLDPFYERAQVHCGLGPYRYEPEAWSSSGAWLRFADDAITTSMYQFGSKRVWTSRHDDVTGAASSTTTVVNGTAIELLCDEDGGRVAAVRCVSTGSRQFTVAARHVVLAIGCIETARLLLASTRTHRAGIGNEHDLVGRYFMDHPQSYLNVWTPTDRGVFERMTLYDLIPQPGGFATMAKLTLSEEVLRREGLTNSAWVLFPRRDHFMSPAFQSFFEIAFALFHQSRPSDLPRHARNMARGWKDLAHIGAYALRGQAYYPYLSRGGWAPVARKAELFTQVELLALFEQSPEPENRIALSDRLDQYGTPRVLVHWRFSADDQERVRRIREVLAHQFERNGLGRLEFAPELFTSPSSVHPIGGARMSDDPRRGVTDRFCRVHGVPNLHLASSAVFPTSGYANPTMTVVALACRIADGIRASSRPARLEPRTEVATSA